MHVSDKFCTTKASALQCSSLLKCMHLLASGHMKSAERGEYVHAEKYFFKHKVLTSVSVCMVNSISLVCHYLVVINQIVSSSHP